MLRINTHWWGRRAERWGFGLRRVPGLSGLLRDTQPRENATVGELGGDEGEREREREREDRAHSEVPVSMLDFMVLFSFAK